MKSARLRSGAVAAAALAVSLLVAVPAYAKAGARTSTTAGNDISYPQCGKPYPSGQAFGIVGLNGGLANNNNACFASEFSWAQRSSGLGGQPAASVYVNTGNPSGAGPVWLPTSNTFYDAPDGTDSNTPFTGGTQVTVPVPSYGACTATNDAGCVYVYGWAKANEDFNHRNVAASASVPWWLDVETSNSWETPGTSYPTAYASNIADLMAMIDYFTSQGAHVGIYSPATSGARSPAAPVLRHRRPIHWRAELGGQGKVLDRGPVLQQLVELHLRQQGDPGAVRVGTIRLRHQLPLTESH
jgi:hypothetical protein